jgi:sarcosine oxidase subunit beta
VTLVADVRGAVELIGQHDRRVGPARRKREIEKSPAFVVVWLLCPRAKSAHAPVLGTAFCQRPMRMEIRRTAMVDVVVIGAGISGAATAYELATAGLSVVIVDRWAPAAMASGWTLAGVRQSGRDMAELPLARASVELWRTLSERLDAPTHYTRRGNLRIARTPAEFAVVAGIVAEQKAVGLDIELLPDGRAVRDLAPAVAETVLGASYCPSDGHADPKATVAAFIAAATRAGAETRFGERVISIDVERGKVVSVTTDKGRIPAGQVVLAAGIFGNELLEPLGLRVPLDVRMVTVVRSVPVAPVLDQVISGAGSGAAGPQETNSAGRQEVTGRFRYTSGLDEWHGEIEDGERPRVRPTARDIALTIQRFGELVPSALATPVDEIWAGLIDQTPDALPVLQRMQEPAGLSVAFGFSGHGFCLGPITGRIMAGFVLDRPVEFNLEPFRIERFAHWNAPAKPITLRG